jgi:hypothetical protein
MDIVSMQGGKEFVYTPFVSILYKQSNRTHASLYFTSKVVDMDIVVM